MYTKTQSDTALNLKAFQSDVNIMFTALGTGMYSNTYIDTEFIRFVTLFYDQNIRPNILVKVAFKIVAETHSEKRGNLSRLYLIYFYPQHILSIFHKTNLKTQFFKLNENTGAVNLSKKKNEPSVL